MNGMCSLAPMSPLKVTTRAVMKFPITTVTKASFQDRPMAMSELPILQFDTANASEIQ